MLACMLAYMLACMLACMQACKTHAGLRKISNSALMSPQLLSKFICKGSSESHSVISLHAIVFCVLYCALAALHAC